MNIVVGAPFVLMGMTLITSFFFLTKGSLLNRFFRDWEMWRFWWGGFAFSLGVQLMLI